MMLGTTRNVRSPQGDDFCSDKKCHMQVQLNGPRSFCAKIKRKLSIFTHLIDVVTELRDK